MRGDSDWSLIEQHRDTNTWLFMVFRILVNAA